MSPNKQKPLCDHCEKRPSQKPAVRFGHDYLNLCGPCRHRVLSYGLVRRDRDTPGQLLLPFEQEATFYG